MPFLGSRTLREKLSIVVRKGLEARVLELVVIEKVEQVAVCRVDTSGGISVRHVFVSLSMMQRIADREERVSEVDESFKEALLARGVAI